MDTAVEMDINWSVPEQTPNSEDHSKILDAVGSGSGSVYIYQSTLAIYTLELTNAGNYTCSVTVNPEGQAMFVTPSEEFSKTLEIFIGKC